MYATSTAYASGGDSDSNKMMLAGKIETLLQMASKAWHLGFFEAQKALMDAHGGNDAQTQILREMTEAQREVAQTWVGVF